MAKKEFIGQVDEYNRYAEGSIKEAIKLDLIDKKILYLLGENARLSNTYMAKKLKIKRETVAYRIKRMTDKSFLGGYLTLLNHRKLGIKNYLVYLKLKTVTNEKELLDYLFSLQCITRLKNSSGRYDIQLVFSAGNEEEFLESFEKVTSKYHNIIQNYDIMEVLEEDFLGLGLILEKEERDKLEVAESKGSTFHKELNKANKYDEDSKLDKNDMLILENLRLNGAISLKDLAKKTSLTANAVKHRIKRLISAGIIKKFIPLASLNQLGYQWWKVFMKFKDLDKNKFRTFMKQHPNILWYMRFLGQWDFQFSVFAKNNSEFHKILDDFRTEFADNIISYDSIIVFNQFKYVQRVN